MRQSILARGASLLIVSLLPQKATSMTPVTDERFFVAAQAGQCVSFQLTQQVAWFQSSSRRSLTSLETGQCLLMPPAKFYLSRRSLTLPLLCAMASMPSSGEKARAVILPWVS